jgi:hypothetical protein
MARSKQNKNKGGKEKDGKHRKETKEERRIRLKAEDEAREVRWVDDDNDDKFQKRTY